MYRKLCYLCSTFFILFFVFFATGCSKQIGNSVLLWSIPENNLSDGDIVPVYVKSNISQCYIIGIPDTEEKIEVPLWQLTTPSSKRVAQKQAETYAEYQHQYARVFLDGLPIREEPVNISKQVYRLRKDEVIKVLYKGEGAAVMASATTAMEGDWLRVLTSDGTQGWCFSYNLRLFDIRTDSSQNQVVTNLEQGTDTDETLEKILNKKWYPESYTTMIDSRKINLEHFKYDYGFDCGKETGTISLKVPNLTVSFEFNGAEKTGKNTYSFTDTPISVTLRDENYIVVSYTNEKGVPTTYDMVTLSTPIETVIANEQSRREQLYSQLESFGPSYSSSNYGVLTFTGQNTFTWSGYKQLQPTVIPRSALGRGTVSFDSFISTALQMSFDGVITFHFDNVNDGISFLYKIEEKGLRMETTESTTIRNGTITERSSSPVVIFFAK